MIRNEMWGNGMGHIGKGHSKQMKGQAKGANRERDPQASKGSHKEINSKGERMGIPVKEIQERGGGEAEGTKLFALRGTRRGDLEAWMLRGLEVQRLVVSTDIVADKM